MPVEREFRATAMTDAEGNYRLQTLGRGPGAVLGEHHVCISLRARHPPPTPAIPTICDRRTARWANR